MFFIIHVFANVFSPIYPSKFSFPMHLVVNPITIILSLIVPLIDAVPMDVVFLEFSNKGRAILPCKNTFSLLQTVFILAFISCTIRPDLYTMTFLLIIESFSFITGFIIMDVSSYSLCFIIDPVALIHISICMDKPPFSIGRIIFSHTLIETPIIPVKNSSSVPFISFPLTDIDFILLYLYCLAIV